ncbi:ATP synthase delta (OSCP) subunit [Anaplasma phagocytophilum str. CR1007]|uniref:ATP synthase subunit delta n=1 Tax=Anaplasma phagocytophilum str. NCH-1 TaxID=1359161 RepID=A0A0F3NKK1_ANAPH|nr:ATP synthase delta (OSCP) subunit [Anaplasma phagocytophilum str. NCH-1]KJZ99044.1 ATP synthase delta (OSCP) subunit [Anaplasma phagocytophilum str. CR1007]KJZ99770.1 ATP synthase delta (OSCP) subunit [Anaplasma phagocytophilum]PLC10194.1 F0F1 ATP synthase subunit delta [Anaplasma phagocytophilum]
MGVVRQQVKGRAEYVYARVLVDLVKDNSEEVSAGIRSLLCACEDRDVRAFFVDPTVPFGVKVAALRDVQKACALDDTLVSFVCVVVEDGLFASLGGIFEKFFALLRRKLGKFNLEIISAAPLTEKEESKILRMLRAQYGDPEAIIRRTDPGILGGFVAKGDTFTVDASYVGQLRELTRISKEAVFSI